MAANNNLLRDRDIGSTGTSIGTHLALEVLFSYNYELYDKERIFKPVDPTKFRFHIWNIFTIMRNILTSYPNIKDKKKIISHQGFASLLMNEIVNINRAYEHSGTKLKPLLFYPDYSKVYLAYNKNKEVQDTKPKEMQILIDNALKAISKRTPIVAINKEHTYTFPKDLKGPNLFTTHLACDLFNKGEYFLLESHTGALKSPSEYNTKYHSIGKLSLDHIPWMEELLFILGDHNFISPLPLVMRRRLYELSLKANWTVKSSLSKIRGTIMQDTELYYQMNQLKKCY